MKLTDTLFEEVKDIWEGYLEQPFVKELGEGTLDKKRFMYYMLQDYVYLFDYAKVFALGVVKSKDPQMMQYFADLVHNTLNGEMQIHRGYMERLGISKEEAERIQPSLDNISYTHYMLEVGYNEGLLELLVSILSCSWSYAYIGERLNKIPGASEHPFYGEWIQGYSSDEYNESNNLILNMINDLGSNCSDDQLHHLKEIFLNCSRYEARFWDMCYNI